MTDEKRELNFEKVPNDVKSPLHKEAYTLFEDAELTEEDSLPKQDVSVKQPDKFASSEHVAIGTRAFKKFKENLPQVLIQQIIDLKIWNTSDEGAIEISLSDTTKLSPGAIVALAGDFYGLPGEPICFGKTEAEKKDRFNRAFDTLANANNQEVLKLLDQIRKEGTAIQKAIQEGNRPRVGLERVSDSGNYRYGSITRYTFFPGTFLFSRYIDLAKNNFDHFGNEAREAYRIGHEVAMETAQLAFRETDQKIKLKLLSKAFAQELFACHFLTDVFAAGHMRTPRKAIYDHVCQSGSTPGKLAIAGFLAKAMHDEDNVNGLEVESEQFKQGWKSYGDDCYFEPENEDNATQVGETVKAGLEDIYSVFSGNTPSHSYQKYLPRVKTSENPNPLFKEEGGSVKVRKDLKDTQCSDYVSNWSSVGTLFKLMKRKTVTADGEVKKLTAEEKDRLSKELELLEKENGRLEYR